MVRRARRRSRLGVLFVLLVLLALSGALFAARRWKSETANLVRRHTTGEMQTMFLDALGVPPAAVLDLSHPPRLDPARQMREAQIWINPIDHLEYVWIPPGSFEMGCVDGDQQCAPNEGPHHAVSINGFWLGRTETTAEAFERFARQRGYRSSPHVATAKLDPDLTIEERTQPKWPAAWLSANDAAAFCAWAGGRLPTEEEWEYAARQHDAKTIHSWGNEARPPMPVANLSDDALIHRFAIHKRVRRELFEGVSDGFDTYAPAGSFPANRLGLFDLEGNVWEWCLDRDGSPTLRGGSWGSRARDVRISARKKMPSDLASWGTGCRCAISAASSLK